MTNEEKQQEDFISNIIHSSKVYEWNKGTINMKEIKSSISSQLNHFQKFEE